MASFHGVTIPTEGWFHDGQSQMTELLRASLPTDFKHLDQRLMPFYLNLFFFFLIICTVSGPEPQIHPSMQEE